MKVKKLRKIKSELKKDFINNINEEFYEPWFIEETLPAISALLKYKSIVLEEISNIDRENESNEELFNYIVEILEDNYNYDKDNFNEEFNEELKKFIKKILEQYS